LVILQPFWFTWWFISITAVLILGTITLLITFRIRQLFAIEKLKSKLAADLHDNVGAGLTEISILSELAAMEFQKEKQETNLHLNSISNTARDLVQSMSDIVWVVNPKRDTLHDLLIRLKDSYSELFMQLDISFKINKIEMLKNIRLPMEYRQNLFLLFKEAINNSIKHSQCNRLILETDINNFRLKMVLKDNGIGFKMEDVNYGNGIKNIESRAEIINGEINIISTPESGTKIEFEGKIPTRSLLRQFISN